MIRQAKTILETSQNITEVDEQSKNNSLLSLLSFISNDYVKAKGSAYLSIKSAKSSGIKRTLPAFIYATSLLYEEAFDFTFLAESNNPLIPILFSIYLDKIFIRFNDNFLN